LDFSKKNGDELSMVTMLEVIERIPSRLEQILDTRKEHFAKLILAVNERKVNEIILIGSGTSNTSALTSRPFVEKVSGLRTTVVSSNEFIYDRYVYNPDALYIFTSQTGTSNFVRRAQKQLKDKGYLTCCISESATVPLAEETPIFVDMGCGYEEYPMRTIGYCASVFTQMLIGLEIGLAYENLSDKAYDAYIAQAALVAKSNQSILKKTVKWLDANKRKMLRSQLIVFTGAGQLYGLALEGAMKVWEIPQIASVGYELEEGLHGPNYGYDNNHCVIVLNDGREKEKALALAGYMKEVHGNGFVAGNSVYGEGDLLVELVTKDFTCLELAPVVQVLAYRLANDQGRDLLAPHDNSMMESYFRTHG